MLPPRYPIILEADFSTDRSLVEVTVCVHGTQHRETFTPIKLAAMVGRITHCFEVDRFLFVYNQYPSQDIGPRARRSFIQYFKALLAKCPAVRGPK